MSPTADVIVIGGGPAGVGAALELRRKGVPKVVILDREPGLGGATRHCGHSPFGLLEFGRVYFGAAYGRKLEHEAEKAGVDVRTGHSVVEIGDDGAITVASHRGVEMLRGRRIMCATGAREKPRSERLISGDRPVGVITTGTLQSCAAFYGLMPFRRPVIVGSELVALSAILTCLMHGARPVAMIESAPHALAREPLTWFPRLMRIPFHYGSEIIDIKGSARVETVTIRRRGATETIACDGLLLTGQFTPEAALFLQSGMGVDPGSSGPAVDQDGRAVNPVYFASGNVLRAVETGGWAFREGRAVGASVARDLERGIAAAHFTPVAFEDPVKLVTPSLMRRGDPSSAAFRQFQLRMLRRAKGRLSLIVEGKELWARRARWSPERRILVPMPSDAQNAQQVQFAFAEE